MPMFTRTSSAPSHQGKAFHTEPASWSSLLACLLSLPLHPGSSHPPSAMG